MEIQPIKQEQDHISDLYLNLNSKSTPHKLKHKHIAPSALSPHSNPNSLSLYGNPDLSLLQGNNNINNQFPPNFNYYDLFMGVPFISEFDSPPYPSINTPFTQKIPIKTLKDEEYIYVNSKQYYRILQRREKRKKLSILYQNSSDSNKKYHHESRHKHAMNRKRGKGGRFLSKNEKEEEEQKDMSINK